MSASDDDLYEDNSFADSGSDGSDLEDHGVVDPSAWLQPNPEHDAQENSSNAVDGDGGGAQGRLESSGARALAQCAGAAGAENEEPPSHSERPVSSSHIEQHSRAREPAQAAGSPATPEASSDERPLAGPYPQPLPSHEQHQPGAEDPEGGTRVATPSTAGGSERGVTPPLPASGAGTGAGAGASSRTGEAGLASASPGRFDSLWDDVIADVGGQGVYAPSIGQLHDVEDDEYEEEDESYSLQQPMLHGRGESDGSPSQAHWGAGGEGDGDEDVGWGDELQAAIEASAREAVFVGGEARGGQGGGGQGSEGTGAQPSGLLEDELYAREDDGAEEEENDGSDTEEDESPQGYSDMSGAMPGDMYAMQMQVNSVLDDAEHSRQVANERAREAARKHEKALADKRAAVRRARQAEDSLQEAKEELRVLRRKQAKLDDSAKRAEQAEAKLRRSEAQFIRMRDLVSSAEQDKEELKKTRKKLKKVEQAIGKTKDKEKAAQQELKEIRKQLKQAQQELSTSEAGSLTLYRELDEIQPRMDLVREQSARLQAELEEMRSATSAPAVRRSDSGSSTASTAHVRELERALASAREQARLARQEAARVTSELLQSKRSLATGQQNRARLEAEISQWRRDAHLLQERCSQLEQQAMQRDRAGSSELHTLQRDYARAVELARELQTALESKAAEARRAAAGLRELQDSHVQLRQENEELAEELVRRAAWARSDAAAVAVGSSSSSFRSVSALGPSSYASEEAAGASAGDSDSGSLSLVPVPPPRLHPTLRFVSGYTTHGAVGAGVGGRDTRRPRSADEVLNRIVPVAPPRPFRGKGRPRFQHRPGDPPMATDGGGAAHRLRLRSDDDVDSLEIMGRGQNGAVARVAVVGSSDLGKPCAVAALKVLFNYHGQRDTAGMEQQTRREYDALLRLPRHRNIIRLLWQGAAFPPDWVWANCLPPFVREIGTLRAGPGGAPTRAQQLFMLLEMLPMTLKDRLAGMDGLPPYPLLVSWARDLCEGALHLLQHGVVHRDMKLDNVMWDDGTRRPIMLREDAEQLVQRGEPVPSTQAGTTFAHEAGDGRLVLIDLGECLQADLRWGGGEHEQGEETGGRDRAGAWPTGKDGARLRRLSRALRNVPFYFLQDSGGGPGGNQEHLAPEVLNGYMRAERMRGESRDGATIRFDGQPVFELGVLIAEMAGGMRHPLGKYPPDVESAAAAAAAAAGGAAAGGAGGSGSLSVPKYELGVKSLPPTIPRLYPLWLQSLVCDMLQWDPDDRPTLWEVRQALRTLEWSGRWRSMHGREEGRQQQHPTGVSAGSKSGGSAGALGSKQGQKKAGGAASFDLSQGTTRRFPGPGPASSVAFIPRPPPGPPYGTPPPQNAPTRHSSTHGHSLGLGLGQGQSKRPPVGLPPPPHPYLQRAQEQAIAAASQARMAGGALPLYGGYGLPVASVGRREERGGEEAGFPALGDAGGAGAGMGQTDLPRLGAALGRGRGRGSRGGRPGGRGSSSGGSSRRFPGPESS